MPTLSFYYGTDYPESYSVGQIVQANLAAVGIKVELKGLAFGEVLSLDYSTAPTSRDHPSLQWVSLTNPPVPSAYADAVFTTGNSVNLGGYSDPTVDKLCLEADGTLNSTLRAQLYWETSNIVYNSYSYIFEGNMKDFFPAQFFVFRTNVHGYYYQSAFSGLDFSTVYLS
jgi:ABC-type transport system substrate-binding protein